MRLAAYGIIAAFFALCGLTSFAAPQREILMAPVPDWPASVGIIEQNNPLEKQAAAGLFTVTTWSAPLIGAPPRAATAPPEFVKLLAMRDAESNRTVLTTGAALIGKLVLFEVVPPPPHATRS